MSEPHTVTTPDTSDGYHTFRELYHYRMLYNAALFNEWARRDIFQVHKSKTHANGEPCFGGEYFIVVAQTPYGQISNHYQLKHFGLFHIPEWPKAAEWDGHTPRDAAERLEAFLVNFI